jgi:hypothetical protein
MTYGTARLNTPMIYIESKHKLNLSSEITTER